MAKYLSLVFLILILLARAVEALDEKGAAGKGDETREAEGSATESLEANNWLDSIQYGRFLEAKLRISERKYREALQQLDRIAASTPEEESLKLILLGQCYEGLPAIARALTAYRQAEKVAPPGSAAVLRQGILQYKLGDRQSAMTLLRRYIDMEPGNPEAFYYLFLLLRDDDPHERARFARKVVLLDGPNGFWSAQLHREVRKEMSRE